MRAAAVELTPRLGQQIIIENRSGGAAGIIGAQACAVAAPDGYTFCAVQHNTMAINSLLFDSLPYDAEKDLAPVARLFFLVEGLAVSNALGAQSVEELKRAALARGQGLNFGTMGQGSYPELFLKWINKHWGVSMVGIPYRGGAPIAQALVAGDIHIGEMGLGNFLGLAGEGKLKIIAVSTEERSPLLPDVPTFREAGIPFPASSWWGLAAPRATPAPVIRKVSGLFSDLMQEPKFAAVLHRQAVMPAAQGPDAFLAFIGSYRQTAKELIDLAGTGRSSYRPE